MPMTARPSLSWLIAVNEQAMVVGWRVTGLVTPVPSRIDEVFTAHSGSAE